MLFVIGMSIIFAFCVVTSVILGTRLMRKAYEKRFTKNVRKHLDVLPRKKEPGKCLAPFLHFIVNVGTCFAEPLPTESNILSFSLLERFYASQQPQLTYGKPYKMAQTDAYVKSLPSLTIIPMPPLYEEIDLSSPTKVATDSPPPTYIQAEGAAFSADDQKIITRES